MRNAVAAVLLIVVVIAATSTGYLFGASSRTIQTTTSTAGGTVQPCGDLVVRPGNSSLIPVLLMQPNATAYLCVTYQTAWKGNFTAYPGGPYEPYAFHPFVVSNEQCTDNGCKPYGFSNAFAVGVFPPVVNLTAHTDYVVVLYTITALAGSTGYYSNGVTFGCGPGFPMAVGHSASDVNGSDFGPLLTPSCPVSLYLLSPVSVSVSGMGVVYLKPW